jgi:hypothetical protein
MIFAGISADRDFAPPVPVGGAIDRLWAGSAMVGAQDVVIGVPVLVDRRWDGATFLGNRAKGA